ncbi:MAG: hypothetical protein MZW92_24440 [Comamonadaceae bacterium]|nr:hypothetical protein [Comamonadaceae bacterium]
MEPTSVRRCSGCSLAGRSPEGCRNCAAVRGGHQPFAVSRNPRQPLAWPGIDQSDVGIMWHAPQDPELPVGQNVPEFDEREAFMAESIVVSGLVAKHREIAGRIDHHRKEIERLGAGLTHLDATLKLFAPDLDLRSLKPKVHRQRNVVFRPGEVPRFILDALREAGRPLTGHALAEQAVALKGLDSTPETLRAVQKSLTTALKTHRRQGHDHRRPDAGPGPHLAHRLNYAARRSSSRLLPCQ